MITLPRDALVDKLGRLVPSWQNWFSGLRREVEGIKKEPFCLWTTDTTLTQHHMGKVNVFNIGSSDVTAYLPAVDETDLYTWIRLIRIGTGQLLVRAGNDVQIEYSSKPGRIWCNEQKRAAANLNLLLVATDRWAIIGATGIWKVA